MGLILVLGTSKCTVHEDVDMQQISTCTSTGRPSLWNDISPTCHNSCSDYVLLQLSHDLSPLLQSLRAVRPVAVAFQASCRMGLPGFAHAARYEYAYIRMWQVPSSQLEVGVSIGVQ